MQKLVGISLLAVLGCQGGGAHDTTSQQQALVCEGADVPIYRNRFAAQAGASGVATGAQAAEGVISSDAPAGGATGAPVATAVDTSAAPAPAAPPTTGTSTPADPGAGPLSAMTVT